ncbi:hypothetical protein EJ06DRAFT_417464 [Trichodelitschia bisporula]|uniref:Uncharacterized protein n=1 Tax=Trichodelitschia bisporula TaxID=703511 RepID=A0A6G1HY89_9PEZI|nr:hypothetical protein EJ06DRAFT_417464 [Trichodelitschia bisporula]
MMGSTQTYVVFTGKAILACRAMSATQNFSSLWLGVSRARGGRAALGFVDGGWAGCGYSCLGGCGDGDSRDARNTGVDGQWWWWWW